MSTPRMPNPSPSPVSVTCFAVHAQSDQGLLPRVVGVLAKRGLIPDRWVGARCGPGGRDMQIDLQVAGLSPDLAAVIAEDMRAIVCVSAVLMSDKVITAAA
jgi:hypothetical protein